MLQYTAIFALRYEIKSLREIAIIFMLFSIVFPVISCESGNNNCEHKDSDCDKICDNCEEEFEPNNDEGDEAEGTVLTVDNEPLFRFVVYTGAKSDVFQALRTFAEAYQDFWTEIEIVRESDSSKFDGIEILVGPVSNRGEEYFVDMYPLGKEGYVIKAIDDKILLSSGSSKTLPDTIEKFFKDYLGYKEGDGFEAPENVSVKDSDWKEKIQDNYKITSLKVNGNDIKDYVIACDTHSIEFMEAATVLQKALYEKVGIYLPVEKIDELSQDELKRSVILPTEFIIVNMPDAYRKNFKISPDEFISNAGLNVKFMTTEEYKEYQKNNP